MVWSRPGREAGRREEEAGEEAETGPEVQDVQPGAARGPSRQ